MRIDSLLVALILLAASFRCSRVEELGKILSETFSHLESASKTLKDDPFDFKCSACVVVVDFLRHARSSGYLIPDILSIYDKVCPRFLNKITCDVIKNDFARNFLKGSITRFVRPGYICQEKLSICKYIGYKELSADTYAKNLLQSKPKKTSPKIDPKAKTWKVLQISDMHIDHFYKEGSLGHCSDYFLCCRTMPSKPVNKSIIAGKWGFQGSCDIPYRTAELFIKQASEDKDLEFIIWTGDNPSHNFLNTTESESLNATDIVTDLILKYFNTTQIPVYPSIGNHEKFPLDQLNTVHIEDERPFFKHLGDSWKSFLTKEAYETFVKFGYYTMKHRNTDLRIVSINTLACSSLNMYVIGNPTDPLKQLQWLENILLNSEKINEPVYIIGHINPGDANFLSECSKRYFALADRFSYTIRGHFYGHTHNDHFTLIPEYFQPTKILSLLLITPSLTTYKNRNPAYKVYEVDSNTMHVKDYVKYYLDLDKADLSPKEPRFQLDYRATQHYNITDLTDVQKLSDYTDKILTDESTFQHCLETYFSRGKSAKIFKNYWNMKNNLYCKMKSNSLDSYMSCVRLFSYNTEDYIYLAMEQFSRQWFIDLMP